MSESAKVDHHVHAWYAQPQYWVPQEKTAEWPDRILLDQGALIRGKRVLNLGCFYPEDEEALGHLAKRWWAIDFSPEVIERCNQYSWGLQQLVDPVPEWTQRVRFDVVDMRAMFFHDEVFDVVTDFSSGDHLLREDWVRTIAEVNRVLVPDGYFLVCFANRDAFIKHLKTSELGVSWAEQPEQFCEYGYVRTDTPAMMRAMLEAGGFEVVRESHCSEDDLRAGMLAVKR